MPDELGLDSGEQYGITGRLAKVTGSGTLQGVAAGSDLAEFPIAPGRNTQVIRVGDNLSTAEHFYVHVLGKPKEQECVSNTNCPSFDVSGTEAPYDTRPKLLTPFLTPLFDEDTHWLNYQAYRALLDGLPNDASEKDKPLKPLPAYVWQYRPEYQFSQFELEIQEINRTVADDEENETTDDIYNTDNPEVYSGDDYLEILYSLISSQSDRLTPIDGQQELILEIGGQEYLITIGADQTILFDDLSGLGALTLEDFLTMRLYTNNDAGNILWEYAFDYISPIYPDFNRDGDIVYDREFEVQGKRTDLVSRTKPFVFWINDDNDRYDKEGSTYSDEPGEPGSIFGTLDWTDDEIDGTRDLVDFFAIAVDFGDFFDQNPDYESFSFKFQQAENAVNVVYTDLTIDESDKFLNALDTDNLSDVFGAWQSVDELDDIKVHLVTSDGTAMNMDFIRQIADNPDKGVFLLEGRKKSENPLELIVKKGSEEVFSASLPIKLVQVNQMYREISIRGAEDTLWSDNLTIDVRHHMDNLDNQSETLVLPDIFIKDQHVLLMHGFGVDEAGFRATNAEVFKRLYHSGSNHLLTGITWNGNEDGLLPIPNYWRNVKNAFNTSDDLAGLVKGIGEENTTIIGHSLANMVIGLAIQDFNLQPKNYFMMDPAVPQEAYIGDKLKVKEMRLPIWDRYATNNDYSTSENRYLWASEWYSQFPDDDRKNLTWRNRLAKVLELEGLKSYYSEGEEVLRPASEGYISPFQNVSVSIGHDSWVKQEKHKGNDGIVAINSGGASGGWDINEYYVSDVLDQGTSDFIFPAPPAQFVIDLLENPADIFAMEHPEDFIEEPLFEYFNQQDLHKLEYNAETVRQAHAHELAYSIPALSDPAGSTPIDDEFEEINQLNMNDIIDGKWPESERDNEQDWWHSDFKDMAYLYVYKVYKDMVDTAELREQ